MPKLNEQEVKQILLLENRKKTLIEIIDDAISELTYTRMDERLWWKTKVNKYCLNEKKYYRIWIDGEILEERRLSHARREIL